LKPDAAASRPERRIAETLATSIRDVLGADLVGIYLSGSAVTGGFDPGISDLDLAVVTARQADRIDLAGLDRMHGGFVRRHPDWNDRIEAVYVGLTTLGSFRTSRDRLAVISPGEPFHVRDDPPASWLQNWYLARETGIALVGPAASEIVPPITWQEFVDATARYAGELASGIDGELSPGGLAYAVLTMCRASMTVRTDRHVSKLAGARWVSERMHESAGLIEAALLCRSARGTAGFNDSRMQAEARTLIRRLAAELGAT
jgi:predicted nucleotidyltransferase